MDDIFEEIVRLRQKGEVSALASIVRVKGSTPRAEGSKMLVRQDGSILGSVGGGCLEASVWEAAMAAIKSETASVLDFDLTGREDTPEGLICGGIMEVMIEPIVPQPTVYILGAGHIGFALARIAKIAGFQVAVVDDRPAYANKERFPDADKIVVDDPVSAIPGLNLNKVSFVVIACRGHLEDQQALAEAVKTPAGYIGMLGSKKKVKTVFANLKNQGVSDEALKRIHAPIGIPIATDSPEEIAVSILAEMVDVRRQKNKKAHTEAPPAQSA